SANHAKSVALELKGEMRQFIDDLSRAAYGDRSIEEVQQLIVNELRKKPYWGDNDAYNLWKFMSIDEISNDLVRLVAAVLSTLPNDAARVVATTQLIEFSDYAIQVYSRYLENDYKQAGNY
ncbi:hypothetical protein, partial [Streptomyces sp. WAC02707]|uniref:hypothetical protein n=1 Tax=Streptomyces sp. WAC02707 TaxID=2487417 RepID=UPI00163CEF6C